VTVTRFTRRDLIVVPARIAAQSRAVMLRLALDTAASETLIKPALLARLGYGLDDSKRKTVIRSAIGVESGYLLCVERFWALGFEVPDHIVHAHEMPDSHDIDGLLGLRFLNHFDYTVHSRRGEISVELAAP
jgi:Aspartyl protease